MEGIAFRKQTAVLDPTTLAGAEVDSRGEICLLLCRSRAAPGRAAVAANEDLMGLASS